MEENIIFENIIKFNFYINYYYFYLNNYIEKINSIFQICTNISYADIFHRYLFFVVYKFDSLTVTLLSEWFYPTLNDFYTDE